MLDIIKLQSIIQSMLIDDRTYRRYIDHDVDEAYSYEWTLKSFIRGAEVVKMEYWEEEEKLDDYIKEYASKQAVGTKGIIYATNNVYVYILSNSPKKIDFSDYDPWIEAIEMYEVEEDGHVIIKEIK